MRIRFNLLFSVSIVFLAFMLGTSVMHYRWFGYGSLNNLFTGLQLSIESGWAYAPNRAELMFGALKPGQESWRNPPAPDVGPGLGFIANRKVQPGLTLYTPVYPWMPVSLIDHYGNTYHSWSLGKNMDFGPRLDGVEFKREINPAITDMHVYPNGNLLVVMGHDLGFQPYGYGLAMLSPESSLIWSYMKQTHHQLDVAPDGRIAVLLNKEVTTSDSELNIATPFLDELVVLLSPDGRELASFSMLEAFRNTPWESVLQFVDPIAWDGDIFHANAAKFLTFKQARAIPGASRGDLLVSLRNIGVLAVLNPETAKIVWATQGPWHMQHDPDVLENGNIIVFDNRGDLARGGRSRVLEFEPTSVGTVWEWPGKALKVKEFRESESYDLYTSVCGAVERLKNGNTLIAETNRGRMLEVSPKGVIVWEYYVPERVLTKGGHMATKVWHPQRIAKDELPFLARRKAARDAVVGTSQP